MGGRERSKEANQSTLLFISKVIYKDRNFLQEEEGRLST